MSCYDCLRRVYRGSGFFYSCLGMLSLDRNGCLGDEVHNNIVISPHHPRSQDEYVLKDHFLYFPPGVSGEMSSPLPSKNRRED